MINEDLDAFLADHGLPCACKGVSFLGIKDSSDADVGGGGSSAQANMVVLTVKTSDIVAAGIKHGVVIVVDGTAYSARNPERVDDGAFSTIPLTKVQA